MLSGTPLRVPAQTGLERSQHNRYFRIDESTYFVEHCKLSDQRCSVGIWSIFLHFQLWKSRYKKFIDIAGRDIDFYTVHLYDGSGVNNKVGRRSGANSEAILDIIEAYSYKALGEVKPYAITEYGRLVPDQADY